MFSWTRRAEQLGSNAFLTGPSRYRKEEDRYKMLSDKFPGRNSATLNNYHQQPKHVYD